MSRSPLTIRAVSCCIVGLALTCLSGCTSALTTAALREALWDAGDHAAESAADVLPSEVEVADVGEASAVAESPDAAEPVDAERRAAAIDEAVSRLARLGPLDPAAKSTLVETLQRTAQEDWPVVVEAFATTLEATGLTVESAAPVEPAESAESAGTHVVAKADLDTVPPPAAPAPTKDAFPPVAAEPPAAVVPHAAEPPPVPGAITVPDALPNLVVRNPCFASRVHAWGRVDRFPSDAFRPGQEVIVYFELDNLSASESPAGHTTCIDTSLALVNASGTVVEDWSFEPIAETCRSRRRDYFARHLVRLPADLAAGECRLELKVVDTLAGTTARETLPLAIVEPVASRE